LALRKALLWIAGAALIPLVAGASTNIQTTISLNGAPISLDRCTVVLPNSAGGDTNKSLSELVDFTNIGQRTATQIHFAFEIVDAIGRTLHTITADEPGRFAPGIPVNDAKLLPTDNDAQQSIDTVPSGGKVVCSVQMVHFDDGSDWHEGDGPAGNAAVYTPLPAPSESPPFQFPENWATPP
jgi:hypothetical protein